MNRVKKLKVKKSDGTFTDYIPIGVDAKYVDLEYNGSNVEKILKKKPYYFNNVEEMKNCEDLVVGDMAITLGYYEINDGGGAEYEIVSSDLTIIGNHQLKNSLTAKLIIKDIIKIESLGAYGDNEHDDTAILQDAINFCGNNGYTLTSIGNKTFLISSTLHFLDNRVDIDFHNSTITTNSAITMIDFNLLNSNFNQFENSGYINHLTLDMNNIAILGIHIIKFVKKSFSDITIKNVSNTAYQIDKGAEILFEKSHFFGTSLNSIGLLLNAADCHYTDIIMIDIHTCIKTQSFNYLTRIHCWMKTKSLIPESKFLHSTGGISYLNQCYSDTFHYSFYISDTVYSKIKMIEQNNHYNQTFMDDSTIEACGGTIYMFYFTENAIDAAGRITISDSNLQGLKDGKSNYASFSNLPNYDENLIWVDSHTYIGQWKDYYKNKKIKLISKITDNHFTINENSILSQTGNVIHMFLKMKISTALTADEIKNPILLGTLPTNCTPEIETVWPIIILPGHKNYNAASEMGVMWISSKGKLYFATNIELQEETTILCNTT